MPYKNPEDKAAYYKKWREKNKEKIAASNKKYREQNRDKVNASAKKWRLQNKEKIAAQNKEYRLTPAGIKSRKISDWKQQGMVAVNNDWDLVYETYINTTCCNNCNKEFKNNYDKHLDHDHQTGEIRGVLCCSCNLKDVFAT